MVARMKVETNTQIVAGTGTQVQSDWKQTDETQVDYIKNKPDIESPIYIVNAVFDDHLESEVYGTCIFDVAVFEEAVQASKDGKLIVLNGSDFIGKKDCVYYADGEEKTARTDVTLSFTVMLNRLGYVTDDADTHADYFVGNVNITENYLKPCNLKLEVFWYRWEDGTSIMYVKGQWQ